jgi:hypothetical protein
VQLFEEWIIEPYAAVLCNMQAETMVTTYCGEQPGQKVFAKSARRPQVFGQFSPSNRGLNSHGFNVSAFGLSVLEQ